MRLAARVDKNQNEIVDALRYLGFDVDIVSREKKMYDVIVSGVPTWANRAVAVRVEIKTTDKDKLTEGEQKYWDVQRCTDNLILATCVGDVLRWFGR